jgi:hypothetical protein
VGWERPLAVGFGVMKWGGERPLSVVFGAGDGGMERSIQYFHSL